MTTTSGTNDIAAGRALPNDEYAERVMIGLAMTLGHIPDPATTLNPADFYRPVHELIWANMVALTKQQKPCDITTVRAHLQERGQLNTRTGVADLYLFEVFQGVPPAVDSAHVTGIILDRSRRRELITVFERGLQNALESEADLGSQLELVGKQLGQIAYDDQTLADRLLAGVRDLAWLNEQQFQPLHWIVPEVIPEGYSLLVGAPKIGKSWLSLSIALAAAAGGYMFGKIYCGRPRPVLLLALEDSDRRIQGRVHKLQPEDPAWPALLSYVTHAEPGTAVQIIQRWLTRLPADDQPLIIIDTIGKLLPAALVGESQYQRDYRFSSQLQAITQQRPGMALIGLHHDRKASSEDFVESISGTNGIAGAADTILVINRPRNEPEGLLKITGRDVEENEVGIKLVEGNWTLLGDSIKEAVRAARTVHATANLGERSAEIVEFVAEHPEGVRGEDVSAALGLTPKEARTYLARLYENGRLQRPKRGLYTPIASVVSVVNNSPKTTQTTQIYGNNARARESVVLGELGTCATCGNAMRVLFEGQTTHPACEPGPDSG